MIQSLKNKHNREDGGSQLKYIRIYMTMNRLNTLFFKKISMFGLSGQSAPSTQT